MMRNFPTLIAFVGLAFLFSSKPVAAQGIPVPGKIEVEDYSSFFDLTAGNDGGGCRTDNVDLYVTFDPPDGGCHAGYTEPTEWLGYQINVAQTSTYVLSIRVSHPGVGGTVHVEVDGVNVTGAMTVPDTGGWSTFRTIRKHGISLTAGQHTLKLVMDTVTPSGSVGSFAYLVLATSAPFGGTARAIPGRIETEDFDVNPSGGSGQDIAYRDVTPANIGGAYRLTEAVDISGTGDVGGGFQVGWTEQGEWLGYTVNIRSAGGYEFRARVAHPGVGGTFHMEIDGQDVTGPMTVPDTGGWSSWRTISKGTISLPAGVHVMYVVLDSESSLTGAFANVNHFELLPIDVVSVSGSQLTVDDVPGFYVFVSYFDYNDVSEEVRRDFSEFQRLGINGVRMFPNWWNWHRQTDGKTAYAGDTLIQPDGTIDDTAYSLLLWYLDRAREHNLIVDLSFSAESVAACAEVEDCLAPISPNDTEGRDRASLTFTRFKNGIVEVARRLKEREDLVGERIHGNVVFDIQNEGNGTGPLWTPLTEAQVSEMLAAIRQVDSSRILFTSTAFGDMGRDGGGRAQRTGQDVVAYHQFRQENWWTFIAFHISEIRSQAPTLPIYFQESPKRQDAAVTAEGFLTGVCEAKRHGATAWNFHTRAGFHMNISGFFGPEDPVDPPRDDKLIQMERDFLEAMAGRLAECRCIPGCQ